MIYYIASKRKSESLVFKDNFFFFVSKMTSKYRVDSYNNLTNSLHLNNDILHCF